MSSFVQSLEFIYINTPGSDRILLDCAIQQAAEHFKTLVQREDFEKLCKEDSGLCFDILNVAASGTSWALKAMKKCIKCASAHNVSVSSQSMRKRTFGPLITSSKPYYCLACDLIFD